MEFLEVQGVEKLKFYNKIGMAASNFSSGGLMSEIGGSRVSKILLAYPQLDARWLLTGQGEMFILKNTDTSGVANPEPASTVVDTLKKYNSNLNRENKILHRKLLKCMEDKETILVEALKHKPSNKL